MEDEREREGGDRKADVQILCTYKAFLVLGTQQLKMAACV